MNFNIIGKFVYDTRDKKNNERSEIIGAAAAAAAEAINENDYDTAVTIAVMCFNKVLSEAMESVDIESETFFDDIDNIAAEAETAINSELTGKLCLQGSEDNRTFIEYISALFAIISGARSRREKVRNYHAAYRVKYMDRISKDFAYYTQYNDCHSVFTNIISFIPEFCDEETVYTRFTREKDINIPYIYSFIFDYINNCLLNESTTRYDINSFDLIQTLINNNSVNDLSDIYNSSTFAKRFAIYQAKIYLYIETNKVTNREPSFFCLSANLNGQQYYFAFFDGGIECPEILDLTKYLPSIQDNNKKIEYSSTNVLKHNEGDGKTSDAGFFTVDRVLEYNREAYRTVPVCPYYAENSVTKSTMFKEADKKLDLILDTAYKLEAKNKELQKKNEELEKANAELKKLQKEKQEIVSEFTHRYRSMNADSLHDIAQSLLDNSCGDEIMEINACKILIEYNTRQNLRKDIDLLSLRHKDNLGAIYSQVKESISLEKDDRFCLAIDDIIQDSLSLVLVRLLVEQSGQREYEFRERMNEAGIIIDENTRTNFLREIIRNSGSCVEWIKRNLHFDFVIECDDEWRKLYFMKFQFAYVLITNQLTELFFNAFDYADYNYPVNVSFTGDSDYLYISFCNHKRKGADSHTSNGLYTMNATLNRLNGSEDSVIIKRRPDFSVRLKISRSFFKAGETDNG